MGELESPGVKAAEVVKGIIIRKGLQFQMTRKRYYRLDRAAKTVRIYKSPAGSEALQEFRVSAVFHGEACAENADNGPSAAGEGVVARCDFHVTSTSGETFKVLVSSSEYEQVLRAFEAARCLDETSSRGSLPNEATSGLRLGRALDGLTRIRTYASTGARAGATTLYAVAGRVRYPRVRAMSDRAMSRVSVGSGMVPRAIGDPRATARELRQRLQLRRPLPGAVLGLTSGRRFTLAVPTFQRSFPQMPRRLRRRTRRDTASDSEFDGEAPQAQDRGASAESVPGGGRGGGGGYPAGQTKAPKKPRVAAKREGPANDAMDPATLVAFQALELGDKDSVIDELSGKLVRLSRALKSLQAQLGDLEKEQVAHALKHIIDEELLDVIHEGAEEHEGADEDGDDMEDDDSDADLEDEELAYAGGPARRRGDTGPVEASRGDDGPRNTGGTPTSSRRGNSQPPSVASEVPAAPPGGSPEDAAREVRQKIDAVTLPLNVKDDFRIHWAASSGGIACLDRQAFDDTRGVAKEIIQEIGKKVLSGQLSLHQISISIRCMMPKTSLQVVATSCATMPFYLRKAALSSDNVERMKLVICMWFSVLHHIVSFRKPLNGLLGETFHAELPDGTQVYLEQVSYHPQVVAMNVQGAERLFTFVAAIAWEPHAGLNTIRLKTCGIREVTFADGHVISFTSPTDQVSGTFFGSQLKFEAQGKVHFEDSDGNSCDLVIGGAYRRHSDYFEGTLKGPSLENLCRVSGTYLGYIDFDGCRYWDIRHVLPMAAAAVSSDVLPSDSRNRRDRELHEAGGRQQEAQMAKEAYEAQMAEDRKLRQAGRAAGRGGGARGGS